MSRGVIIEYVLSVKGSRAFFNVEASSASSSRSSSISRLSSASSSRDSSISRVSSASSSRDSSMSRLSSASSSRSSSISRESSASSSRVHSSISRAVSASSSRVFFNIETVFGIQFQSSSSISRESSASSSRFFFNIERVSASSSRFLNIESLRHQFQFLQYRGMSSASSSRFFFNVERILGAIEFLEFVFNVRVCISAASWQPYCRIASMRAACSSSRSRVKRDLHALHSAVPHWTIRSYGTRLNILPHSLQANRMY